MNSDLKLFKWVIILLLLPLGMAIFGGDGFRYPCQNPANWDKDICKMPLCDVTRTCPEHIFKGQKDPRQGQTSPTASTPQVTQDNKGCK